MLPTLLYACETWTVYQRHAKRLNHFHTRCLRKLLKVKWQDKIPDTEVLKRAGMQSVHTLLNVAQLRWTGHVTRMAVCQRKSYMENCKRENVPKGVRRSDTRTLSKPPSRISTYLQRCGNNLHRTERSGEASSERGPKSMKQKEQVLPSRNVLSGKPEQRHHQRILFHLTFLALTAAGSSELRLVSSATSEHTNRTSTPSKHLIKIGHCQK